MSDNKIGLYIHIPFCVKKCLYCDFASYACGDDIKSKYIDVLCKEITAAASKNKYLADTLYIGGGTPSILDIRYLDCIMNSVYTNFAFDKNPEITIEMNPGTANYEKIKEWNRLGINRISIGLQSADDEELHNLGRIYRYNEFVNAYKHVRKAGFENVNIDVMSAIPGQTIQSYEDSLYKVIRLEPEHISSYSLIIEEGTPYYEMFSTNKSNKNVFEKYGLTRYTLPDEDTERKMYEMTGDILYEYGYERYEISNYARKGFESRHNSGYWTGKEYIGVGVSASSYINNERFTNTCLVDEYINNYPDIVKERETVSRQNRIEEFMFLGLRLTKGVSKRKFFQLFGNNMDDVYDSVLSKHIKEGLIESDNDIVRLTKKGIDVSNYVLSDFILQ